MSNFVLVLDSKRKPLNPCRPITARKLLSAGKAKVFRQYPFTLILNKEVDATPEPMQLNLDPGSKTTGIAIKQGDKIVFGAELQHRGQQIKDALETRRGVRRSRRNRHTRYRQPRFLNRTRQSGWLAPSLQHRVDTVMTWVNRLCKLAAITSIAQELVRFDLQLIKNPELAGVEYQQGELQGYEVKEYLLEKWNFKCAYCGVENVPFEIEHIQPKSKGGSDRVSNLTIACHACNQAKGNQDVQDFLSSKPDLLNRILLQAKSPLKDAAAVNSTRWAVFNALKQTGLPVSTGTGGQTKFNRTLVNLPKSHWLDAACVGKVEALQVKTSSPLLIAAKGHGTRRRCRINKFGFPCSKPRDRYDLPWKTGDVASIVKDGKRFVGKVVVQSAKRLEVRIGQLRLGGTLDKFVKIHSHDGYQYVGFHSALLQ